MNTKTISVREEQGKIVVLHSDKRRKSYDKEKF